MNGIAMLTERAKEYAASLTGDFHAFTFARDMGITDPELRDQVLADLVALKLIEPTGRKAGAFRPISAEAPIIAWQTAKDDYYPLKLPLGIDRLAGVNPRALVVIAGETNGGKSYFSMLIAHANLACNGGAHKTIHFWNSETTPMSIRKNAERIDADMDHWHGLDVRERTESFHQVIVPDGLNIVDYLQIEEEFYLVGKKLKAIFDVLTTGVCIVFMQKNKGAALGIGGAYTLHKPVLALSLNEMHGVNACRIDKLKMPRRFPNAEGMEYDFKFNEFGGIDTVATWRYLTKKNREELWKQYESERALNRFRDSYGDF